MKKARLTLLTTPEFNYGVPALMIVLAAVVAERMDARTQRGFNDSSN